MIEILKEFNNFKTPEHGFYVDGCLVGYINKAAYTLILDNIEFPLIHKESSIHLGVSGTVEEKTLALESLFIKWRDNELFDRLKGWRNERYSVYGPNGVLIDVERAACGLVGVRTYGCHMNGYVHTPEGIKMWVGKRSATKQTYPGMLDNMVAGMFFKMFLCNYHLSLI